MYYTILTQVGLEKEAQAIATGIKLPITEIAIGDGNGSEIIPDKSMTSLVNEVWRGDVDFVVQNETQGNWVTVESHLPVDVGGWTIREVGLFDSAGDMIAIANYPATPKPVLQEGIYRDTYLRLVLAVESTSNIELTIDAQVVMATREYVDGLMANLKTAIDTTRRRAFFNANTLF